MRQERLIGIVGGLGPFAHIDFERKLLAAASTLIGARRDQDFPQWVLSSIPQTPDRTEAYFGEAEDPTPVLLRSLERLRRAGADFAVVACNTAHLFLERLREESPLALEGTEVAGRPLLDPAALLAEAAIGYAYGI